MRVWARKDAYAEFTKEEFELIINASLYGEEHEEAAKLLSERYDGSGYLSGEEIAFWADEVDPDKYKNATGFDDIEWGC